MDHLHDEYVAQKPRYWLCTAGFGLTAVSMALLALSSALVFLGVIGAVFHGDRRLLETLQRPWFTLAVGLPIPYLALVGSYLLWGRWTDLSWQRRAGFFLLLNAFDAVVGTMLEANTLGVDLGPLAQEWVLGALIQTFGWIEFWLAASLAAEVASHLRATNSAQSGRALSRLALFGFVVSSLLFIARTDWKGGFPLKARGPIRDELTLLLVLGTYVIRGFCAAQVATLCFVAAGACRRTYREICEWEGTGGPFYRGSWGERGD